MRQSKYLFLTIQQFVFIIYFVFTTTIFFIASNYGNEGIALQIFGGGDDGFFYWEQAKNIAAGRDAILTSIYPLIIGYLIKIAGIESVYIIRIFNYCGFILLVLLSIYLIEMLFKLEGRKIESKYALSAKILLLVCFLFYASLQMNVNLSIYRDIWIYTLYVLSIILSIRIIFYKKKRFLYLLLLIPSLWLLGAFRRYALLSFLLTIIIYYGYRKFKGSKPYRAIIVVLIFFGIYYTFFMDYIVPVVNMSLRAALNYRLSSLIINFGGSQMWISLDHGNFFIFLINYFHSYIGNLLGPLPWHISGTATLFVFFVESIPMTLILMFLWRKRNLISSVQKYVLLHSFIWISLIAVSNDNIGTATRLRPVAWILIIIVFVSVYSKNRYFKNNKISIKLNS